MKRGSSPNLLELKTDQPVYRGFVLAKSGGRAFLVSNALPGETVLVDVKQWRKDYAIATAIEIINPSKDRILPQCQLFSTCGGCHYQYLSHPKQISIKEWILRDCLSRIAKIELPLSEPLLGNEWRYRLRANLKCSDKVVGFFKRGSRDLVPIDDCLLIHEDITSRLCILQEALEPSFFGQIEIAGVSPPLLTLIPDRQTNKVAIRNTLKRINETGLSCCVFYDERVEGRGLEAFYTELTLQERPYRILPTVFFQSNWQLNQRLTQMLQGIVDFKDKKVLDLYCGAGNFSLVVAQEASKVVGFEENPLSVKCAKLNAENWGLINCSFYCNKAEDVPLDSFDIAIVNPPRLGLTKRAIERLIAIRPEQIVYLSCDPATFARDLAKLKVHYTIDSIRLIDFFPQTYHIETLAIFSKNKIFVKS